MSEQERWDKTRELARKIYWHSRSVLANGEGASWHHAWQFAISQGFGGNTSNQFANDAQRYYEDTETPYNQCLDFVRRGYTNYDELMDLHGDDLTAEQKESIAEMMRLNEEYF